MIRPIENGSTMEKLLGALLILFGVLLGMIITRALKVTNDKKD